MSLSLQSRRDKMAFAISGILGGSFLFLGVRRAGLHRMIREKVSPLGGNLLLFVATKWIGRTFFAIMGPLEVQGEEKVPRTGGLIVAPNHISDCDVPAMFTASPRWMWFVAKEELFEIKVLKDLMPIFHAFPIRRGGAGARAAMKHIMELLRLGDAVIIFPEGKLTEDGYLQEFEHGAAALALKAGVPVVPAALVGTRKILPYTEVMPKPSFQRVRVRFGEPVDFTNLPEAREDRLAEATRRIRAAVIELLKEIAPETIERAVENEPLRG